MSLFPIMANPPGGLEQYIPENMPMAPPETSTLGYFLKGWEDAGGWSSLPGMVGESVRDIFGEPSIIPGYPRGYLPGLQPESPFNPGVPVNPLNPTPWASGPNLERPPVANASIVSTLAPRGPGGAMGMGMLPLLMALLNEQQSGGK